jgi:hypothetical protein
VRICSIKAFKTVSEKDQDTAMDFYTAILGCKELEDMPMEPGAYRIGWKYPELKSESSWLVCFLRCPRQPAGYVASQTISNRYMQSSSDEA